MKKLLLFACLSIFFCARSLAQDFSFDELLKTRKDNYPAFESLCHDKGYLLDHLESNERCSVFKNHGKTISFYTYYDGYSYKFKNRVAIKFETRDLSEYEKLKHQCEAVMTYSRTKLRRFYNKEYLEHLYRNDEVSVHLFDIQYKEDEKPYYMIEVYSLYTDSYSDK